MSDAMPPPPPRVRGPGCLLRAAVHNSTRAGAPSHHPPEGPAPTSAHPGPGTPPALPLGWEAYFDHRLAVECPTRQATFNVYQAGAAGPVVLCLHGGGYTGLSWALFAQHLKARCRVMAVDLRGHGLSSSAEDADLSAATLAADVAAVWRQLFAAQAGSSTSGSGSGSRGGGRGEEGSSGKGAAHIACSGRGRGSGSSEEGAAGPPATVLVGHSMGGAIAVRAAALNEITNLAGVVVVDVVEGTALSSLPFMDTVLAGRPYKFTSLEEAVQWAMATGMCRQQEAAHISLPSMLRQAPGSGGQQGAALPQGQATLSSAAEGSAGTPVGNVGAAAAAGAGVGAAAAGVGRPVGNKGAPALGVLGGVSEEGEGEEEDEGEEKAARAAVQHDRSSSRGSAQSSGGAAVGACCVEQEEGQQGAAGQAGGGTGWVWRTPLRQSKRYWEGWYKGLSDTFLALKVPKILVLAGTDRLDRQLTIGQMQGRFQLVLLPQAGHAVHEDEPERTAEAVGAFIKRFRIGEPPLQLPRAATGVPRVLPIPAGPPA